jgi:protein SCO1/2
VLTAYGTAGGADDHQHTGAGEGWLPRKAPTFRLIDQTGKGFRSEDLKGKAALITFLYTNCTTVCPVLMTQFLGIQKAVGNRVGSDLRFVTITVDPERDTPQEFRRFAAKWKVGPGWTFLTGSPEDIAKVAKAYGVAYRKRSDGEIEHSNMTYLVDRKGMLRSAYRLTTSTDQMAGEIQMILREQP